MMFTHQLCHPVPPSSLAWFDSATGRIPPSRQQYCTVDDHDGVCCHWVSARDPTTDHYIIRKVLMIQ